MFRGRLLKRLSLRRLVAQVVAGVAVPVVPLAYASPPDPTWIAGIYDNADYDDVVLAIASAEGVVHAAGVHRVIAVPAADRVRAMPGADPAAAPRCVKSCRAPPLR